MAFKEIDAKSIDSNVFKLISDEWALIAAGNEQGFNMMTASWGFMGEIWYDDYVVALVRPQRYTREFLDDNETFALCFLGDNREPHKICGSKSGRNVDKAKETGLTPVFENGTVYFKESRLVIICKKTFVSDIKNGKFFDKSIIEKVYSEGDFHKIYLGKIEKVLISE